MQTIQTVLSILIVVTVLISLYYSFRFRRNMDPKLRGLYAAKMNIAMGVMLILIAISQLFFFTDTALRRAFGVVCLLLGLFNLFAGLRNYAAFSRRA